MLIFTIIHTQINAPWSWTKCIKSDNIFLGRYGHAIHNFKGGENINWKVGMSKVKLIPTLHGWPHDKECRTMLGRLARLYLIDCRSYTALTTLF